MSESKSLIAASSTEIVDKDLRTKGAQIWTEIEELYGDGRTFNRSIVIEELREHYHKVLTNSVEIGKRLQLIKAFCDHGDFVNILNDIGINQRTAERYMGAAKLMVTSKVYQRNESMSRISISKIYEICKLSEEDQNFLLEEGQVGGMSIEAIPDMSVRALSDKISSIKDEKKALEKQLEEKNKKIDDLDRELQLLKKPSQWSERAKRLVLEIGTISVQFNVIANDLHKMFEEINELQPAGWSNEKDILRSRSQEVMREMFDKMDELGDVVDWMAPADNDLLQSRHRMYPLNMVEMPKSAVEDSEVEE